MNVWILLHEDGINSTWTKNILYVSGSIANDHGLGFVFLYRGEERRHHFGELD